ncbi:MAG: hypothetical protein IPJ85_18490 [Flavobacteriales bacterium]|nr:hypothetical protein [Flavobacteriales bacterium]
MLRFIVGHQRPPSASCATPGDIVWSGDPERDTLDELLARMREFSAAVLEPKGVVFRFNSAGEQRDDAACCEERPLPHLQGAVNNASKRSQATVVVTFAQERTICD